MVLWWILIPVLLMFGVAIFVRRSRGKTPGIPGGLVKVVHREGPTCLSVRLATRCFVVYFGGVGWSRAGKEPSEG